MGCCYNCIGFEYDLALPNFLGWGKDSAWITQDRLNYGLDIQGGLHLVMGVDVNSVVVESSRRLSKSLVEEMKEEKIIVSGVKVIRADVGNLKFLWVLPPCRR